MSIFPTETQGAVTRLTGGEALVQALRAQGRRFSFELGTDPRIGPREREPVDERPEVQTRAPDQHRPAAR